MLLAAVIAQPPQERKPEWVTNPEKTYPNSQYLSAVGTGDSRKEAENSAVASLARIFESKVRSEESINARYVELMKASGKSEMESRTDVNKNITVSSAQTLYNVRFPESYTDNLGKVYVLAVIEREPTAAIYKNKIHYNQALIASFVSHSRESKDPVDKYANMNAALVTAKLNEVLRDQLGIIMLGMTAKSDTNLSVSEITEMCAEAQKNVSFAIQVSGNEKDNVTGMLKELVSDLGFPVEENGAMTIKGNEKVEQIDLKSEQKFVRWSCQFSVLDQPGTSIISLSANGREGHLTYSEAEARALRSMREKLKKDFGKKINNYFDSLVMK